VLCTPRPALRASCPEPCGACLSRCRRQRVRGFATRADGLFADYGGRERSRELCEAAREVSAKMEEALEEVRQTERDPEIER